MRKKRILFTIIVYAFISRFWQIDKIPPLINPTNLSSRFISAALSIGSALSLYFYAKMIFRRTKIALLASLIFLLLPWTIEQGRIASQVNNTLFLFLVSIFIAQKTKNLLIRWMIYLLMPFWLYFVYPQFWLFHANKLFLPLSDFINNIFILTSADFLLFKNITFWWGGVREVGILYPVFLPFLLLGLYQIVISRKFNILVWMGLILLISAASSFFPESREYFFVTPFLSMIIASGMNKLDWRENRAWQFIYLLVFALMIYDMAQFWHYYSIHYPQQVAINQAKIHEPF